MKKIFNAVYDDSAEESMLPLFGEEEEAYKERLAKLRSKRHARMNEKDNKFVKAMVDGTLTADMLEIVEDS